MQNNIGRFLTKRAELNRDLEAAVDVSAGLRLTFGALNARANRIANAAVARGVLPGDRVALLMMNSVEYIEAFFGLAKIGAVVVPLNWRLVADELSYILKNSGSTMLLYSDDFSDEVSELQSRGAEGTDIRHWIELGGGGARAPFAEDYAAVCAEASPAEPECTARDDDMLFIMYTSGTTGLPKGVMHTHETFLWAVMTMTITAELRFQDRYAIVLPLFHVGGLLPIVSNMHRGVTSIIVRQFDPKAMWEVIERERITVTLAVPSMLNFMLLVPDFKGYDYSHMRWIISGAEPVPVTLIERFAEIGIEIHQAYGLTESGGPACLISPENALKHIGSTGKAFFHTEVRIVDEHGRDVPPGVPGEVVVRARHIMKGYWNNPEATAQAIRDGWLHTGDIAYADAEGFITIHDRVKDMVISGGENVYPAEVENVIMQHPDVAEVAVIGQPSARWGESPLAIVVPKAGAALAEGDLLRHCTGKLARFKLPKAVAFVDEIPRNPAGKALKRILREQFPGPALE